MIRWFRKPQGKVVARGVRTQDAALRRRFTDDDLDKLEARVETIERLTNELRDELEAANLRCTGAKFYDAVVTTTANSPRWNTWIEQVKSLLYKDRCLQNVHIHFPGKEPDERRVISQ